MPDIVEHLFTRGADINFIGRDAQNIHELAGVSERFVARGEPWHGVGQNVLTWRPSRSMVFAGHD